MAGKLFQDRYPVGRSHAPPASDGPRDARSEIHHETCTLLMFVRAMLM